jgi:hypothetical protein
VREEREEREKREKREKREERKEYVEVGGGEGGMLRRVDSGVLQLLSLLGW